MTLHRIRQGIEYKFNEDIYTPNGSGDLGERKRGFTTSFIQEPEPPYTPFTLPLGDGTCNDYQADDMREDSFPWVMTSYMKDYFAAGRSLLE